MAVFSPNCADISTMVLATLWAGGIVCPLNNLYTVGELSSLLKSSGATALATHVSCLEVAREAAMIVGLPYNRIVLLDEEDPKGKVKHFESLREEKDVVKQVAIDPKEDLAFLVYSSGTTGLPKGVMLTHRNIVANILQNHIAQPDGMDWQKDSVISFLPMFHIYGKSTVPSCLPPKLVLLISPTGIAVLIFIPIHRGITMHIMQRFDLPQFLTSIQTSKITIAYVVPPVVLLLGKHPLIDKFDLSSLRMMMSAAAPLTKDLIEMVYSRLKVPIKQSYGMSEAAPGITCQVPLSLPRPSHKLTNQTIAEWNNPLASVGKLIPSMSLKIMSQNTELPPGKEGEIYLRGPNIFVGYHQNPTATAEAFSDGWFRSGDVGYVDDGGNLFLTDRFKELIKYNGFQVAPAQLEGLLLGHEAVDDVAVIGVYSKERATELPRAYVVVAQEFQAGEELERAIRTWLESRVAPHKKLRGGVRFVEVIPKSNTGKVLRRVLAEEAKKEEERSVSKAKL